MTQFKVALIDKTLDQIPDWVPGELEAAGIHFVYSNCQSADDLLTLAQDVNVLWIYGGNQLANAENLPKLKDCIAVIRSGSGVDRINVDKATELGMVVVNTPHAHHDAVSDHAIALMFAVGRKMLAQDKYSRTDWKNRDAFLPLWRLRQKTIGLIGFGLIPQFLVRKLAGFEPQFLVYDPFAPDSLLESQRVRRADLASLLSQSDIVSIHTPLTAETHHLIGEAELKQMKSDAILINTARGPVIEETALVKALEENWIAGAGLDVFEVEPTTAENPLMQFDNIVVTPHTAGFSDESVDLTWRLSVEACIDLANGYYPRSYVNRSVKPRRELQTKVR
ncbi:MAG: hypothetical protein KC422_06220 [Trueperaceae bacterium]|nr:hypothetical protein [Trueperaceae bacterium]